ncbi:MAG: hypothetical protein WA384_12215 [Rhodomicrobium sp.]
MTISYRIFETDSGYTLIESGGRTYAEEDLCDSIWLISKELRGAYLPKRERNEARKWIKQYEELLSALRSVGA